MHHHRIVAFIAALVPFAVAADEGMWPFHGFPAAAVKGKHGVDIDAKWLDAVRAATVRLEGGCSGSFVSGDGLVLTNHHCVASCAAQNSTPEHDLLRQGFVARQRADERRCQTQQVSVLVGFEDVSAAVLAVTAGKRGGEFAAARRAKLTELEQACEAAAKARGVEEKCEVVTLYQGGQYWLYRYERYSDVRLAFAPEQDVAAFGGDPDNFQFPRWCLDFAFLRVYRDDKPARTPRHLRFDFAGPKAGSPVFVVGNPGTTRRLLTLPELRFLRDVATPTWLLRYSELRGRFIQYGKTGDEPARIIQDDLQGIENGIKVNRKVLDALHDESMIQAKAAEERALRAAATAADGDPWAEIAAAEELYRGFYIEHLFMESRAGFQGDLFNWARQIVRGAAEREKPNPERLAEFTETRLPRVAQALFAAVPVHAELERLELAFGFERMREWLGPDHATVRALLGKESPDALAARLVRDTALADSAARKALWDGGRAAVDASRDPMILLAKAVDAEARALRKRYEGEVEAPIKGAQERIAALRFKTLGTSVYPDATFTPRITYGTVRGWEEGGRAVDPFTRLGRLFERATGDAPFALPAGWVAARPKLDADLPFNYVADTDITGGNSGSPVIDARGRVVGVAFDGNIHAISGSFWFDAARNRTVAVHPAAMRAALVEVYAADALAREIGAR